MRVEILGCSGGIGGGALQTTSLLIDNDILIDAGTGVTSLSLSALKAIDHVFITHAHLDHIACLPFILDSVGGLRTSPLTMHATKATEDVIRKHIFNWQIWPDFSLIPSPENPFLCFNTIAVGAPLFLGERAISALPANHSVPAVGYRIDNLYSGASLVFTGDTTSCAPLWDMVNRIPDLRYLLIEAAFPNRERELAILSKHLCPSLLLSELNKLQSRPEILVTHAKPGLFEEIESELRQGAGAHNINMLIGKSVLNL